MLAVVPILFGAIFTVATAFALGTMLIQRLQLRLYRLEAAILAFVCGSACLSLAVFLLCLVNQARASVFMAGAAAAFWGARRGQEREAQPKSSGLFRVIFPLIFATFFVVYLANAMAPEISPDGSGYHLGNVVRLWRHHGFDWQYHSMYSYLSQGMEMLFLVAFSFGGHSAAAMVHLAFLTALPLLVACYGQRTGFPRAGQFAGLILFVSPLVGKVGISAYNDVAAAVIVFAIFYFIEIWREEENQTCWIAIGLLAGFAYGVKYTAVFAIPFALIAGRPRTIRQAGLFALTAGIMVIPWLLRNWFWLGNPAAPFFNHWFPNQFFYPGPEQDYMAYQAQLPEGLSWREIPLDVTLFGKQISGFIGPIFLLAPVSLLAARFAAGRRLLLAAAVFTIPVFFNATTRFLIPALPFAALAMGMAVGERAIGLPALALLQAVLCWPSINAKYSAPYSFRIREIPIKAALRKEPEAAYIARNLGDYGLKQPLEQAVGKDELVFSFAGRPEAYIDRHLVVSFESALGMRVRSILWAPTIFPPLRRSRLRFPPMVSTGVRISQPHSTKSLWTISEVRILHGRESLRPSTFDAAPNRWEAGLAFDGNPATAWSTWQPRSPRDFVQCQFSPRLIDEVVVESAEETGANVVIEILQPPGQPATALPAVQESRIPASPDLPGAATRGVLSFGIKFLLVQADDFIADELRNNTSRWGLTLVSEVNGVRLYRIEP